MLRERLRWNHFCKVSLVEQQGNVWILHLCQKLCLLNWYVFHFRRSSPILKLSKNSHSTEVEESLSTGYSITKFKLQTIFQRCFENARKCFMKSSAIKFLFSKLQFLKLQPLALRVLKITEIPEIAPTGSSFLHYQTLTGSLQSSCSK